MDSFHEGELPTKVADWLGREGYPLEYYTAHTFRRHGFSVEQGSYVKSAEGDPREVDVLASMAMFNDESRRLARIYTVVECKWTKNKPWVAFTSRAGRMMSSALVAQTIGSEMGEAAIFLEAGEEKLHGLALFQSPEMPCFGGRQAFGKETDVFYNAIKSVAGAARSVANQYNVYKDEKQLPEAAVLTFPVIVIEGDLFEAAYDDGADQMNLTRVNRTRLHWSGSKESNLRTTVDVVTKSGLEAFASQRAADTKALLEILFARAGELANSFQNKSASGLYGKRAATGTFGVPPFLHNLRERAEKALEADRADQTIRRHAAKSNKRVV